MPGGTQYTHVNVHATPYCAFRWHRNVRLLNNCSQAYCECEQAEHKRSRWNIGMVMRIFYDSNAFFGSFDLVCLLSEFISTHMRGFWNMIYRSENNTVWEEQDNILWHVFAIMGFLWTHLRSIFQQTHFSYINFASSKTPSLYYQCLISYAG